MPAISETYQSTISPQPFGDLLTELAWRMRQYDAISRQLEPIQEEERAAKEALEALDRDLPLFEQPQDLAYAALQAELASRKAAPLKSEQYSLEHPLDHLLPEMHPLVGRKIMMRTLDRDEHPIGTSRLNEFGQEDGQSRWHTKRSGKIIRVMLNPVWGGEITIEGWRGNRYSAHPLIDRRQNYSPAVYLEPR